jgi:hypothetical protein
VWARENTREEIFAALKRREVYASTGPRITVRFFGGWRFSEADADAPDVANVGYANGLPMGGEMTAAPAAAAPTFLIRAAKDPDRANLDRIQVVKGWLNTRGAQFERVYNVAASDARSIRRNELVPVGSTVDIANASYRNSIGDPELSVVWQDPNFDDRQPAFYYLRVLEIPTPRWTAYDAMRFSLQNVPSEVPMVSQERAYSSPIWYHL